MPANHQVLSSQYMPAKDRNFILFQSRIIIFQGLFILRKAVPAITDRGQSQANHQLGFGSGIAHKVTVQTALLKSLIHGIAFQGKMIHANFMITMRQQFFLALFIQGTFQFIFWHIIIFKTALAIAFNPRHMRITIKGQTVRI